MCSTEKCLLGPNLQFRFTVEPIPLSIPSETDSLFPLEKCLLLLLIFLISLIITLTVQFFIFFSHFTHLLVGLFVT